MAERHTPETKGTLTGADLLHKHYNPYSPGNFDSGGFGFGGTNGSAGGFGAGGMGPQTGAYGSQSNYGQGYPTGDTENHDETDILPEAHMMDHKANWTDGLPHDFKGWGPQTPDPDAPEHIRLRDPEGQLNWGGKGDERQHIVWRFEHRRH